MEHPIVADAEGTPKFEKEDSTNENLNLGSMIADVMSLTGCLCRSLLRKKMINQDPYKSLRSQFPNLYGDIPFECGAGWYHILLALSLKIMEHIKDHPDHMHKYGEARSLVSQVKEKYGTLRYYVYETCDAIYEMIEEAEELSSYTCEACGKIGAELRGSGWIVTRCEKCWQSHYDKLD